MTDRAVGISDEELSEHLDGRGDPQERARLAAAIERDADAAGRLRAYAAYDEELRALGAAILAEPVPEHLRQIVQQAQPQGDRKGAPPRVSA